MLSFTLRHSFAGVVFALFLMSQSAMAQTTAFTYQGKLSDNGIPANGSFDLQVMLFDTATVGTGVQQGTTQTLTNVTVSGGIFTVQIDFGVCASCFNGSARFLEIAVKPTSGSTFTTLVPRQLVNSTPYSIKSQNAATADGLSVACISCITSSQIGSVLGSSITGAIPIASLPPGSGNYIQNTATQQSSSNFNITGTGIANAFDSATQFKIGGLPVLSVSGIGSFANTNTFTGIGAGAFAAP